MIVRSPKGKSLLEKVIKNTESQKVDYDKVIRYNTAEYESKKDQMSETHFSGILIDCPLKKWNGNTCRCL